MTTSDSAVRAIVLVGGAGTRLRPLTLRTPKQLVPVLNRPLLEHLLTHLRDHHITRITLAMTERSEAIRTTFGDGSTLGIELDYAYEDTPLGSGGAIASVAQGWDEPFLVCNGDIITDINLTAMLAFHREHDAQLTMHLHEVEDPSGFGVAVTAPDRRVTRFIEKPPRETAPSRLINAGNWLFEPSLLDEMDATTFNRIEDGLFPALCEAERPIYGFSQPGYWKDIGNAEALRAVNLDLVAGAIPGRVPADTEGVLIGTGTDIAGAIISKPSVIGSDCQMSQDVSIDGSVVWDSVSIDAGVTIANSIIASGVTIGRDVKIERSVVAHGARIGNGAQLIDATIEPDEQIEAVA
jgi:NDP-sugar pyrophosphorylase family protein